DSHPPGTRPPGTGPPGLGGATPRAAGPGASGPGLPGENSRSPAVTTACTRPVTGPVRLSGGIGAGLTSAVSGSFIFWGELYADPAANPLDSFRQWLGRPRGQ